MKKRLRSTVASLGHTMLLLTSLFLVSCYPARPAAQYGYGTFKVQIDTPLNGAVVTSLTGISGNYDDVDGIPITGIELTLLRASDGKFWDGNSWGGSGSTILPTQLAGYTWAWQGTPEQPSLPTGTNATTGLSDGFYHLHATAKYAGGQEADFESVIQVGITAPPLTSTVYSWGSNQKGAVGTGVTGGDINQATLLARSVALDGKNVAWLSASSGGTLALTSERKSYGWGDNNFGALGILETYLSETPVPLAVNTSGVLSGKQLALITTERYHTLAISADHRAFTWGSNAFGELGTGDRGAPWIATPVEIIMTGALTGKTITSGACGGGFTVALNSEGGLASWGYHGGAGCLGDGSAMLTTPAAYSLVPVQVLGLGTAKVKSVTCGDKHTLALTTVGTVFAFGANWSGQLGDGTLVNRNQAVPAGSVGPMAGKVITAVEAGESHSLALDVEGKVYVWGDGEHGQLGNGTGGPGVHSQTPTLVGGALTGKKVVKIAAGGSNCLVFTSDNKLFAWGGNDHGQLCGVTAIGTDALVPTEVDLSTVLINGRVIQHITCGDGHAAMLVSPPSSFGPDIEVEAQGTKLTDASGPGIHFGTQAYGASVPVYVSVHNMGSSDLAELDAWVDGPNGSDFSCFLSQPPVLPGSSTGFYVFFQPHANANPTPTTHTATLHIRSNDADENTFDIALTGTGYQAGKPEAGFNAGLNGDVYATVVQPDGKILLGGSFTSIQPVGTATTQDRGHLARLNADGTLDSSFHPNANDKVHSIAVQHDGKILIGGWFTSLQPGGTGTAFTRSYLARLNADGTVDTGFVANLNWIVRCVLPQRDGKILVGGQFTQVNNGSGNEPRNYIARLNENGTLDTTFNPNANGEVLTLALDSQDRIIVGGYFSNIGGATRYKLARLDAVGVADGFSPVSSSYVYAVAMESDGSLLVGGDFTESLPGGGTASNLLRVKPDGTLDPTFRPNPGYRIQGISVQADGSILVSGSFTAVQPSGDPAPTTRNRIARIFPAGSLDSQFNPDANGEVYGCAIQADGKVVPAGSFYILGGEARYGTARLSNNSVTDILTVPSLSSIEWQRGGAAPETTDVRFDLSTDSGATWTPLSGTVSRTTTGWEITGITLPSTGRVRARARTTSGNHNGSSGIVQASVSYGEPPDIAVLKDGLPIAFGHSHEFGVVGTGGSSGSIILTIQNTGGSPLKRLTGLSLAGSSHFTVAGPSSDSVAAGGSGTLTVRFQPRTTGIHSAILHLTSNVPDTPTFDILLSGTGSQPITTWKQIHHGQTENSGVAADTAAPAGDGMTNLEKYARNLDPNIPATRQDKLTLSSGGSSSPAEEGETAFDGPGGSVLLYTYSRNKLALADVVFQVEWSDTLAANDWHTTDVTEEIITDDGQQQEVKASIPVGSSSRRFVRLKMTRK